jgi:hypothetical protein
MKNKVEEAKQIKRKAENLEKNLMSAIDSMERTVAATPLTNANTNTFARNANEVDMEIWTAKSMRQCETLGMRPRYLRYNVYRDDKLMSRSCAEWTEVAQPLASIPLTELNHTPSLVTDTIKHHPELFEVSTPINVDNLEKSLIRHPNPDFVQSVLDGLRNGFWPWAWRISRYIRRKPR